jgi:predicted TIM-barrel fold metal-dependent hydrolase
MLPSSARLISVDDHIIERRDLWVDRLPAALVDTGPHVVELEDGREAWAYEDELILQVGLNAVAGKDPSEFTTEPVRFDDMRRGCWDPVARLDDMDVDGVHAQLGFPSFPRFCGQRFLAGKDKKLALLCVQAYNDFILDEWCATDPARFIPLGLIPLWDVQAAVAEVERVSAKGMKAIAFSENPSALGLPSFHTDHWDPFFAAVEAARMPLCMHIGSSSQMISSSEDAPFQVHVVLNGLNSIVAAGDLLCSQVFRKFPGIRIALSEGGAGWVPYILEKAEYTWDRHGAYGELYRERTPTEVFQEHFGVCIISDDFAVENRQRIGINNLMWECDYPHADTLWPNSRKVVEEMLLDVPDDEALRIAELNARDFFDFRA